MIGRTLEHYRVEALLGRGGMGVVYRAVDTRLHRPVALKVLSEDLVHDPDPEAAPGLGISAVFGANTVTSGGQNVHGIGALVVCAVLGLIFPAVFAGVQKPGYIFLGLRRRKRSEIQA